MTEPFDEPILFIQCRMCSREEPAWYDDNDKPDIPATWRAMSTECCPAEVYVCSPKCAMQCGYALTQNHRGGVIVREIEAFMDDDTALEMLSECEAANGTVDGPRYNDWEREFIESCRDQLGDGRMLSSKQIEKLQELWGRI